MKKCKFLSALVLLFCLTAAILAPAALALDEPQINAPHALLMEAESGQVIYEKAADDKVAPASTTKIVTALVALQAIAAGEVGLSDVVTFTQEMTADLIADGSSVGLQVGETMTLEQLLYGALLASGNDACNAIAVYVSGSTAAFVEKMNALAQELGCTGTHFANAHGAPANDHYTTARDMARIAQTAYSDPNFITISGTANYVLPATNMSESRSLNNSNALISPAGIYGSSYLYEPCTAGKTGHTSEAGYCLVSFAGKDGKNLICVVMGCTADSYTAADGSTGLTYNNFVDSKTLYEYGFNNFQETEVLSVSETVGTVDVEMGAGGSVALRPRVGLSLLLPTDIDMSRITRELTIDSQEKGEPLQAPIDENMVLGTLRVFYDGNQVLETPVVAASDIPLSHGAYIRSHLLGSLKKPPVLIGIAVVVVILVLYFSWVARYRKKRKAHLRSVEEARRKRQAYLESLTPEEREALQARAREIRRRKEEQLRQRQQQEAARKGKRRRRDK